MRLARELIDADAERVVRKLARSGYKAYLVGGCVRDLLLQRAPKDFDVATSATPSEIKNVFRNCRIIGRRFRLAHIFFGSKIIETSTFRANPRNDGANGESLLIRRDNVFGTAIEDARRRDFTINGLFFDAGSDQVIDYVGGLQDLEARLVRTIGDPDIRFQEDPVRILRAIKFAARLGFNIEPATYAALLRHREEIRKCAPPRVLEELYRLLRGGAARRSMELLTETGVDRVLAPQLATLLRDSQHQPHTTHLLRPPADEEEAMWHAAWADDMPTNPGPRLRLSFATEAEICERRARMWQALAAVDRDIAQGAEPNNTILLSLLLQPFMYPSMLQPGIRPGQLHAMVAELATPLLERLHVARRDAERIRQVLVAQRRMGPLRRRGRHASSMSRRDYLSEAMRVYELASQSDSDEAAPWQEAGVQDENDALELERDDALELDDGELGEDGDEDGQHRRRRRRGGRRRRRSDALDDEDSQMSTALGG